MTPHDYYNAVIGRAFDEDGVYGAQCVDGFKHFCRTVVGYNISHTSICNPTGYATSIWDNFEKLGLNRYFDKVPANQMVDGDWAIWAWGARSCPYSHVAMFRKDNGNGTGIFLGQNQNGTRAYTQCNIYYDGLRGGLRPKCYHPAPTPTPTPTPTQKFSIGTKVIVNGQLHVDAKGNEAGKTLSNFKTTITRYAGGNPYPYNISGDLGWLAESALTAYDQAQYVNLPANINHWNFYDLNKAPVKANAKGYLNPAKFGGLSYKIYGYRDNGTTVEIETVQFGRVKIYIYNTCASITTGYYKYNSGNH